MQKNNNWNNHNFTDFDFAKFVPIGLRYDRADWLLWANNEADLVPFPFLKMLVCNNITGDSGFYNVFE